MQKKIEKIFFNLEIIAFELVALNTRFTETEYLSSGVNMLTNSLKISDFFSEWPKKLTKILPYRFLQCFGAFNMLTVNKCSDTELCRQLSNPVFCNL